MAALGKDLGLCRTRSCSMSVHKELGAHSNLSIPNMPSV